MIYRVQTECGIMDYNNLASAMHNARHKIERKHDVTLQLVEDNGFEILEEVQLASWENRNYRSRTDRGGFTLEQKREYCYNQDPCAILPIIEFLNI